MSPVDVLTVRVCSKDVLRDVRRLTDSDGIDGSHSQDVLLLGDDALLNAVLQLLHWTGVDPHPFLCSSLAHLNVVAGDGAAAVPLRRFPGNGQEVPAGSSHMQFNGWRRDTWKGEDRQFYFKTLFIEFPNR